MAVEWTHDAKTQRRDAAASAFVSVLGQEGASPSRAYVLRPVIDCYCVTARWGGELQEVNDRSVTRVVTNPPR